MNVLQRAAAPTPPFFRKLRLLGLMLTMGSGAVIGKADSMPSAVVEIAKYVATGGAVMVAVSQVTVDDPELLVTRSSKA